MHSTEGHIFVKARFEGSKPRGREASWEGIAEICNKGDSTISEDPSNWHKENKWIQEKAKNLQDIKPNGREELKWYSGFYLGQLAG